MSPATPARGPAPQCSSRLLVLTAFICLALGGVLALTGSGTAAATSGSQADPALVSTDKGWVRGTASTDHLVFQGIPYAQPPVGKLRFAPPRPVRPWAGIRDAQTPGSPCAQTYAYNGPPTSVGDEDCLYLNVHVPRGIQGPLPVMVFVHGGGFAGGTGSLYDARRVTRQGEAIVVTLNYRLGALGFLAHPDLPNAWAGNYGIADQQAALRWVRHNIDSFGGKPDNVTLWGESAGAYSVCAQLASPRARHLFQKAIAQSGPCGNDLLTRPEAEGRARTAAHELGCADARDVAACLRRVPAQRLSALRFEQVRLTRHITNLPWMPVAGTPAIPLQPLTAARTGLVNRVPVLVGGTRDEMRTFILDRYEAGLGLVTADQYAPLVRELYHDLADEVLAEYPHTRYDSPSLALATLLTDEGRGAGACRQLAFNDAMSGRAPVYAYEFAEPVRREPTEGFPPGALHGADVPYFFDSYGREGDPMPEEQAQLAGTMIDNWTQFARTGRPAVEWATYRSGHARSFSTTYIGDIDVAANHRCGFWQTLFWPRSPSGLGREGQRGVGGPDVLVDPFGGEGTVAGLDGRENGVVVRP